ncbi:unnamed protein product [Ascophyllum nodosum]
MQTKPSGNQQRAGDTGHTKTGGCEVQQLPCALMVMDVQGPATSMTDRRLPQLPRSFTFAPAPGTCAAGPRVATSAVA